MELAHFDGSDYVHDLDAYRLTRQQKVIKSFVDKGRWHTLKELGHLTGYPESSISAQLRHMRKPEHGGFTLEKRHREGSGRGCFEYRVMPPGYISEYVPTHGKPRTKTIKLDKYNEMINALAYYKYNAECDKGSRADVALNGT